MTKNTDIPSNRTCCPFLRGAFILVTYLFASLLVTYCFVIRGSMNSSNFSDDSFMSFSQMIYWTADWPYIYRTLLPSTVRLVTELTPVRVRERVNEAARNKPFLKGLNWTTRHYYECFVALILIVFMWIGTALMWRYLIGRLYPYGDFVADLFPAAGLIVLPALFLSNWTAIYDPMTVFMSTLGLVLIVARKHGWFYVFFPLAILNKISAIMLTGVFLALEYKTMSLRRLAIHLVAQLILWGLVVALLVWLFKNNQGSRADFRPLFNLYSFLYGLPIYHVLYSMSFFITFAFLILYRWKEKPEAMRRMFFGGAMLFVPTVLCYGRALDEFRVWYDLYPLSFLLSVDTVCRLFDIPEMKADRMSPDR